MMLNKLALALVSCVSVAFAMTFQEVCESAFENTFFKQEKCIAKEYEGGLDEAQTGCKTFPNGKLLEQPHPTIIPMMNYNLKEEMGDYTSPKLENHLEPEQVVVVSGTVKPMTVDEHVFMVHLFGATAAGNVDESNEIVTMKFDLKQNRSTYWYSHPDNATQDIIFEGSLSSEITEHAKVEIEIMFDDHLNLMAANWIYTTPFSSDTPDPQGHIFYVRVSGLFDTHSITTASTTLGNRFYGPYINCPRIGLKATNRPPSGSSGQGWMWQDANEPFVNSTMFNWDTDAKEPDNKGGKELCACYNLHSGKLHDIDCDTSAPYVCHYPPVDPTKAYHNCLSGVDFQEPLLLQNKERCLQVASIMPNWTMAMEYCNLLGGHLFHIYNMEDYDSIKQWFIKMQEKRYMENKAYMEYRDGYIGYQKVADHEGDFTGKNIQAMITPTKPMSDQLFMSDQLDATKCLNWYYVDSKSDYSKTALIYMCLHYNACRFLPNRLLVHFVNDTAVETNKFPAICEYGPYKSQKYFRGKKYHFNKAHPFNVLSGMPNEMKCADHCAVVDHCLGFNYLKDEGGSASCELMAREDQGFDMAPNGGIYYEKVSVVP